MVVRAAGDIHYAAAEGSPGVKAGAGDDRVAGDVHYTAAKGFERPEHRAAGDVHFAALVGIEEVV